MPELLDQIAAVVGFSLEAVTPYPMYYGLDTPLGIIGERVLNAIYGAYRVRQLTEESAPRASRLAPGWDGRRRTVFVPASPTTGLWTCR